MSNQTGKKRIIRVIAWVAAAIVGILLIFLAWKYYDRFSSEAGDPLDALPPGTLLLAELNDPSNFLTEKLSGNVLWQGLMRDSTWADAAEQLQLIDSLIGNAGITIKPQSGEKFMVAVQRTGAGIYQLLFLASPAGSKGLSSLSGVLEKYGERQGGSLNRSYSLKINGSEMTFHACIRKGVFIGSFDKALMESSVASLLEGGADMEASMPARLSEWAGRKVDANTYLSFMQLGRYFASRLQAPGSGVSRMVSGFAGWSELDLMVREQDIVASGYTEATDSAGHALATFAGQEAPNIRIQDILPYHTRAFLHFGTGDFRAWYGQWNTNATVPAGEDPWLSWVSKELALADLNTSGDTEGRIAIFRVGDHEKAGRELMRLTQQAGSTGLQDTSTYRSYLLGRISTNEPYAQRLGDLWTGFRNPWFTIIDDYVVFCNERQTLTDLVNQYLAGNSLAKSEEYIAFSSNISRTSNVYLYADLRRMAGQAPFWLDTALMNSQEFLFSQVAGGYLGLQWEWSKENVYFTNLCYRSVIDQNPVSRMTGWQTSLQAPVFSGPYAVYDHRAGENKIIVFDEMANMYLIDGSGTVIWKLTLAEKPISKIYEVDIYKNNKIQYLFNTRSKVYLVDLNGNLVSGFPWSLNTPASGPVAVFDYEGDKSYRLMYPGEDMRIYNYQINGQPVPGWGMPKLNATSRTYVRHALLNGKDMIICRDSEGGVYILSRRGEERIDIKQPVAASVNTDFFVDREKPRHRLLFTDTAGRIAEISQGGDLAFMKLGDYNDGHHYLFGDFNGDGSADHILQSGAQIEVYDSKGKLIFMDSLGFTPDAGLQLSTIQDYGPCLIAHSSATGRISVLNKDGVVSRYDAFRGVLPPLVTRLKTGSGQLLITGEGGLIYLYPLQ